MVKFFIYEDEKFPFYGLTEDAEDGKAIEVSENDAKWIQETLAEFEKVQSFLKHFYERHSEEES